MRETILQTPIPVKKEGEKKEGEEVLQDSEQTFPSACHEDWYWRSTVEQIPIKEAMMEQMDMSEGGCDPQRLLARFID